MAPIDKNAARAQGKRAARAVVRRVRLDPLATLPNQGGSVGKRAIFAEWTTFPEGRRNDDFVAQLRHSRVTDDQEVIFICRSGHRSIGAAEAATADGIAKAYNVIDGFEGALDENDHRGTSGWRAENLPWRQS